MTPSRFDGVCSWVVNALFVVLLAIGALQVLARYVLGLSFAWTEELAVYLFIWLVFLGAGLGVARNVHPNVTLFVDMLPPSGRRALRAVTNSAVIVTVAALIVYGLHLVGLTRDNLTFGLGVPVGYAMYLALPVGAIVMLVNLIRTRRGTDAAGHGDPAP